MHLVPAYALIDLIKIDDIDWTVDHVFQKFGYSFPILSWHVVSSRFLGLFVELESLGQFLSVLLNNIYFFVVFCIWVRFRATALDAKLSKITVFQYLRCWSSITGRTLTLLCRKSVRLFYCHSSIVCQTARVSFIIFIDFVIKCLSESLLKFGFLLLDPDLPQSRWCQFSDLIELFMTTFILTIILIKRWNIFHTFGHFPGTLVSLLLDERIFLARGLSINHLIIHSLYLLST